MKLRLNIRLDGSFRSRSDEHEFLRRLNDAIEKAIEPFDVDVKIRSLGIGKLKRDDEEEDA